jgi:hypothetical protein
MTRNPILEEIYAAREKLLVDYDGDVHAYVLAARERALASGHPIAAPTQRTSRSSGAAKPGVSAIDIQSSPPADR